MYESPLKIHRGYELGRRAYQAGREREAALYPLKGTMGMLQPAAALGFDDAQREAEEERSLRDRLAALRAELDEVALGIGNLRRELAGGGRNGAPDEVPFTEAELAEAEQSIVEVRSELDRDEVERADLNVLQRAIGRLRTVVGKARTRAQAAVAIVGVGYLTAAGEELWTDPGRFASKLTTVINTLESWVSLLQH